MIKLFLEAFFLNFFDSKGKLKIRKNIKKKEQTKKTMNNLTENNLSTNNFDLYNSSEEENYFNLNQRKMLNSSDNSMSDNYSTSTSLPEDQSTSKKIFIGGIPIQQTESKTIFH